MSTDGNRSQHELAEKLEKSRVAVSDMERGRVAVSAADIALFAAPFSKPFAFFYTARASVSKSDLSALAQWLMLLFEDLAPTQQRITLEYVKQQVARTIKADEREFRDRYAAMKAKSRKKK